MIRQNVPLSCPSGVEINIKKKLLDLLGLFLLRSKVFVVAAEKLFVVYDNQRSDK